MEERLNRHIYQFVEAELRDYKTNKKLIIEYDKELEYTGAKSVLSKDPSGRFSQNQISDSTHNQVVRIMANENRIKRAKDYVGCIDDVLKELSEEQYKLIELKYFQGLLTDWGIWKELHISPRTYYREKNKAIRKFALRMRIL